MTLLKPTLLIPGEEARDPVMLTLKRSQTEDGVDVIACDEAGNEWCGILTITPDGVYRWGDLPTTLGLPLTEGGKLVVHE